VWNIAGNEQPVVLARPSTEYADEVTGLAYTADGKLVTASLKQAVLVRDAANPETVLGSPVSDRGSPALDVAAAPDGKTLAIAGQNGSVLFWSLEPEGQPRVLGDPITRAPATDIFLHRRRLCSFRLWRRQLPAYLERRRPANPRTLGPRIDLTGFGSVLDSRTPATSAAFPMRGRSRLPGVGSPSPAAREKSRYLIWRTLEYLTSQIPRARNYLSNTPPIRA
jgi:hypothetical protein